MVFDLPQVECLYLFDYLIKIQPIVHDGMGNRPLGWQDILAWVELTKTPLNAWDVSVIHKASQVYLSQLELSKKPDAPMPEPIIKQDQLKLAKHIKSILR